MCKCTGAICPKHPELEGLRYTSGHNCVGCKNDNATRQYEALKRVPGLEAEVARLRAQHQGEPVAYFWRHDAEHEHGIARGYQELSRERPDPTSEWLSNVHEIIPLYAHVDPGEVERLRTELETVTRHKKYADVALSAQTSNYNHATAVTDNLRAKLAERDALLSTAGDMLQECIDTGELDSDEQWRAEQIVAAISALERMP